VKRAVFGGEGREEKNVYEPIEKKKKKKKKRKKKKKKEKNKKMASNGAKTKSKKKRPMMRSKSAQKSVQKSASKRSSRPKSTGHKVLTRPRSTRKQPGRPPKALPNLRPAESRPSKRGKWRLEPEPEWESESEWDSESELGFGSSALRALRKKPVSKSRVSREAPRSSRSARKSGERERGGTKSKGPMGASKKKSNARKHTEGMRLMKPRARGPSKAMTPPKRKKVASKKK
jgi:hypothetical protein